MVALRQGKECEGWWGQCQKLGGHNQRSMRDVEAELSSKKKAKEFQAVQISQGTLRTPRWLIFFSFAKPVIFMTPQLLFPAGSCPPLPAENSCCQEQSWGGHPASPECSCCPAALGMAQRKRGLSCLQGALRFPNISFPKPSCKEESWGRLGNFASA